MEAADLAGCVRLPLVTSARFAQRGGRGRLFFCGNNIEPLSASKEIV